MKYFEYKYQKEDKEETLKLRLTTSDMKIIEKVNKKSLIDYVSEFSITTITELLMYMNRPFILNYSEKDAETLLDTLIDNGMTLEMIMKDIIMETLVVSGFMKKKDLNKALEESTEINPTEK